MASDVSANKVVVALNAQIDPDEQGGIQSSLRSIINCLRCEENGVDLRVIAAAGFAHRIRQISGTDNVISWPYAEIGTITGNLPSKLNFLRKLPAYPAAVVERAIKSVRRWRAAARTASAAANDAILCDHGVDVVHFSYPRKFATELPFIFEPHDLQHRHFPEFFSDEEYQWREESYGQGCRDAAFVVCGSQWTKHDIVTQFGVPATRVAVVPRSSSNLPAAGCRSTVSFGSLPEAFAIYPATTFEHKNHVRLLKAIALLRDRHQVNLPLICTGRIYEEHFPKIQRQLESSGLEGLVSFLGPVSREDLAALLRRARFMVFPSLFEGLSQTLLEALALGVAIVAANQTSIPETLGDAAVYFDGTDTEAMVEVLRQAAQNDDLLGTVRSCAAEQFRRYSWDGASVALAACYKQACGVSLTAAESHKLAVATGSSAEAA